MCNTFIEAHPNFLQNIFLCVTEGFSTFERLLRANRELGFELEGAEGTTLTNEDEILNEIETFYKQLYNSGLDENDLFDLFVQSLKTPKLQDQQRNELEGEITLAECKVVLRTFSNGKSPGEDSFMVVSLIY